MKPCRKCGACERYPFSGKCAPCNRARHARWYTKNVAKVLDTSLAWSKANPGKRLAAVSKWAKENPKMIQRQTRKRRGWAPGEHERAEAALPLVTKCACCPNTTPYHKYGWKADHNHQTGMFRAYICHPCNIVLGFLEKGQLRREDHPLEDAYLVRFNS